MSRSETFNTDFSLERPPRCETRAATNRLSRILDLPCHDLMQDWAIELADAARISTFCELYETESLDTDEKFALMQLIVASLDDLLSDGATDDEEATQRVMSLLSRDFVLHFYTVEYWSLREETDPTNVFAATPLLRQVWKNGFRPEYAAWIETADE